MTNHPNRNRRATLSRKAKSLGFELYSDHSWHQGDDGMWRSHWALHKNNGQYASPYRSDVSFFRTLAEVDQRLDYEQIIADRLP